MKITPTRLPGVLLIEPRRIADSRGWFTESWNRRRMADAGLQFDFVQDNHSYSAEAGTVRGLHFQAPPAAQAKLVRVVSGAIRDVAVDIRSGSPDFGRWVGERLSADNGAQLLIPRGFLHGFVTLEPATHVVYKVDSHYAPAHDHAVRFDDSDLAIDWGIDPAGAVLSGKDAAGMAFAALESPFRYAAAGG